MQIEVTEKEALMVFNLRYKDPRGKLKGYLIMPLNLIAAFVVTYYLLGVLQSLACFALFVVMASPTAIMTVRAMRAAKRYAREQIEALK